MKIVLSIVTAIAVIGCILLGMAFSSAQSTADKATTELETVKSQLVAAQADLDSTSAELAQVRQDLTDTEANLDKTTNELASTETELAGVKMDLTDTTHQLDTAIAYNDKMADGYASLRSEILEKLGKGEDSGLYVTPNDTAVAARARTITGTFSTDWNEVWRDYKRLYQWVIDNIEYSSDTNLPILPTTPDGYLEWTAEYWKIPSETLEDLTGDCEDMVNLLASMMLSYNNENYGVWAIIIHNEDSGHVAVALPVTGDELAIFDPAGNYYSKYITGAVRSYAISQAVYDWLAYWAPEMPGARITAAYSNDFYLEFDSTSEFIDWAIARYDD